MAGLHDPKAQLGAYVYGHIWALYDLAYEFGLTKDDILETIEEQRTGPQVRRPDGTHVTWAPMVAALAVRIEEKTGRTDFVDAVAAMLNEEDA